VANIPLSQLRPDYNATMLELQQLLSSQDAWADRFPGGIGQTVVGMLSALTAYQQHEIERFFTECFTDSALSDRSIFTIARMLGIRLRRRSSPTLTARVTREGTSNSYLIIPAWTLWQAVGAVDSYANVEPLVFQPGQFTLTAVLHIGSVRSIRQLMTGEKFARIVVSGSEPFSVHDRYVELKVNDVPWKLIQDGLWNYSPNALVAVDSTLGNGDLELRFGNDLYGKVPGNGEMAVVRWLDTLGTKSRPLITGEEITTTIPGVKATVLGKDTVGGDEHSSTFYRVMGPNLFTSSGQATTVDEYRAIGLTYPGIVDLVVIPQRDLDPYDLRLMNVIHMCPLLANGDVWSREIEAPSAPSYIPMELQGNLPAGTYDYRIAAINEVGETELSATSSVTLSAKGGILLQWAPVRQATGYRVYGRTAGGPLFGLVEVKEPRYLDTGADVGTVTPPLANSTRANWWTFVQWFDNKKHSTVKLVFLAPQPIPADVRITAKVHKDVLNPDEIKALIYERVTELFKPRLGTLGRKIARSDIIHAITSIPNPIREGPAVDYVTLDIPANDMDPGGRTNYVWLRNIEINLTYTKRVEY
jgi:hypothetical protein